MQLASSSRFMIEELESRVLLSAIQVERAPTFFEATSSARPVSLSALALPSLTISSSAITERGLMTGLSESGSYGVASVRARLPIRTDPPTVILLYPTMTDRDLPMSLPVESGLGVWSGGEPNAPLPISGGTYSSIDVGATTNADGELEPGAGAPAPLNGTGWVNVTSSAAGGSAPYGSPPGGPNSPMIGEARREEVTGTLTPNVTSLTFQIPVGQPTQSLSMSVRETGGEGTSPPVFAQMDLVNATGNMVAQFGPPSGPGASVLQGMTVQLHNATNGSHIVIQVTTAEASAHASSSSATDSANTAGPQPAPGDNVSFVLDIQRQDAPDTGQGTGSIVQAPVGVGTLVVAPTSQGISSTSSSTWTAPDEQDGESASAAQGPTTAVASAATATFEPAGESLESFNVRLSTGPLASRSASPLGPTLASIDAEATQPVDRHERALSQEIEGLEPVDGERSTAWRSEDSNEESSNEPGSSGFAGSARPVVGVLGSGGFPMMVTSPGRGQHAQLADLWATLPSFADSESSASRTAQAEISLHESPLTHTNAAASTSSSDSAKSPEYVKAACGLALGLALTSGSLFPDLIARLPRRMPKWIANLRPRTGRTGLRSRRTHATGAISTWLRALFVAR
jgi:hypothetical protein